LALDELGGAGEEAHAGRIAVQGAGGAGGSDWRWTDWAVKARKRMRA